MDLSGTYVTIMPILVKPNLALKEAFIAYYKDVRINDPLGCDFYSEDINNFSSYIKLLQDEERGENLKKGYVPCSHRWFLNEHGHIIGTIRIRHDLVSDFHKNELGHIGFDIAPAFRHCGFGSQMLSEAKLVAFLLGIPELIITTNESNTASKSVIINNGGKFDSKLYSSTFDEVMERYRIKT